jgi:hypothetical protein
MRIGRKNRAPHRYGPGQEKNGPLPQPGPAREQHGIAQIKSSDFINAIRRIRHRFSRVVGRPTHVQIEYNSHADRVDHVWITMQVSEYGHMRAAVNTLSRLNRDAGFDGRVRVGIVRDAWQELPGIGVYECDRFDYADIESRTNVFYEHHTQHEIEVLLTRKTEAAVLIEVWGEIYAHNHVGVHQIHSRRSSCAVPEDIAGRDGALKFYYAEDHASELLLFKFCGQP